MKTNLLRTASLSFIFILCSLSLRSQWVSIPDTFFGMWLNTEGYAACMQGDNSVGWQMDTTCPAVVGADTVWFAVGPNDLSGIEYFDSLQTLGFGFSAVSSLSALPPLLTSLSFGFTQLTSLPALPSTLTYLSCNDNPLTSLPALPSTLAYLVCNSNQLLSLPALPSSLTYLDCNSNQLTSLPALPSSLTHLECYWNQLTSLPALPSSLTYLNCSRNQLMSLPALPASLLTLDCYDNQLASLPALSFSLKEFWCSNNQLTSLPALPSPLAELDCSRNQLTSLPSFPDSLYNCLISYNPISCLPELKFIGYLEYDSTNISCRPNYGRVMQSFPSLDSLPLCNVFNPHGCPVFWNISGKTYSDTNSNCNADPGEASPVNLLIKLWSNGTLLQQTTTVFSGDYSLETGNGNYQVSVDTSGTLFYVTCPAGGSYYDTISPLDSLHFSRDFALQCKPGFDLAAWSVAGRFRPADVRTVDIHVGSVSNFYGVNCVTGAGVNGSVTIVISGPASYVSPAAGALTPDNVSGNTLRYNIADFGTVDFNNSFNIMVQTDTTAPLGSQICFTVTVTATNVDAVPTNNTLTHCFIVVGSFDPNDKQVYPSADIDTAQEWLTYTIRFQNTGTAEAQHIYVADTMDADLDVSSFQLLAYSHQPLVQIKENAVRFNFPNINLPDSFSNEPLSHGYVQYKIKIKDGKPIGTQIHNTAYIYFDFNAPVVTNTTVNTIAVVTSDKAISHEPSVFRIYPNPASSLVTINIDESMIGATATITDVAGREMLKSVLTIRNPQFDIRNLESGVYFVTVTNGSQKATRKLVVCK